MLELENMYLNTGILKIIIIVIPLEKVEMAPQLVISHNLFGKILKKLDVHLLLDVGKFIVKAITFVAIILQGETFLEDIPKMS